MARIVTGIKPTGAPHLGNYLGMIRPALELAAEQDAYYFIADYHALNTAPEPDQVHQRSLVTAATLLALGLGPARTALYRQSDVPEVFELTALLATVTPKGLLNRAHAYKALVDANQCRGRSADAGVNMGLFTYPLLMAADILAPAADVVPVGTDGRKMSKSYANTIPVLAPPEVLRKAVMGIVTDSRPVEAAKDPGHDTVFRLFELVAPPQEVDQLRVRYLAGGTGYGEAKELLLDVLIDSFAVARERYAELIASPGEIADLLDLGAQQAHELARTTLDQAREAIGIRPLATPVASR